MKKYSKFVWGISLLCLVFSSLPSNANSLKTKVPPRAPGQKDVLELRCAPIDTVRVGFIGLGWRGRGAVKRYAQLEGVKVVAICDLVPKSIQNTQDILKKYQKPTAVEYLGPDAWKKMCQRKDLDLIYICTDWTNHTPMAVYAMKQGKHVAVEVPAAVSLADCWALVNTAEQTRRHCMQLENCNYDFFEMTTLNMYKHGLLGEIKHAEGAYIHDLRYWLTDTSYNGYWDMWRLKHNQKHNGNYYATHGLGPVAHLMNIHRGDKMDYLVAMATAETSLSSYIKDKFGANSAWIKQPIAKGDMVNTLIRTNNGKTILIQHDIVSPRPYSRLQVVSGTKGFAQKYPNEGYAFDPNAHKFMEKAQKDSLMKLYEHPITKEVGAKARKVGGHGGMDFIMDYRLVYCLRNGLPLDQDVYDAAEWSCLGELTELSVKNGSVPVQIPDFTRGAWKKIKEVTYYQK